MRDLTSYVTVHVRCLYFPTCTCKCTLYRCIYNLYDSPTCVRFLSQTGNKTYSVSRYATVRLQGHKVRRRFFRHPVDVQRSNPGFKDFVYATAKSKNWRGVIFVEQVVISSLFSTVHVYCTNACTVLLNTLRHSLFWPYVCKFKRYTRYLSHTSYLWQYPDKSIFSRFFL